MNIYNIETSDLSLISLITSSVDKSFLMFIFQLIDNVIIIFINISLVQQLLNVFTVSPLFFLSYLLYSFRFQSCIFFFLPLFYFLKLFFADIPILFWFPRFAGSIRVNTIFPQSFIIVLRASDFIKSTTLFTANIAELWSFRSGSRSLFWIMFTSFSLEKIRMR